MRCRKCGCTNIFYTRVAFSFNGEVDREYAYAQCFGCSHSQEGTVYYRPRPRLEAKRATRGTFTKGH